MKTFVPDLPFCVRVRCLLAPGVSYFSYQPILSTVFQRYQPRSEEADQQ